ncbi:sulfate/thiosulfate import ATP-binding protein CysA [Pectobacterium carotovorum subsp. carotovorum]|uniref:sulfate/molybdate ABC transporter ATP-binding protein n=1 Tax=Pectobacterium punjabense TaxID=2108399 RepID=UPI001968CED8|nr:sulfate ABC transporter ATP-binding protein [Pectobacterium punjabense]MBN3134263.1 sulfate ABC transporter ATP-binding protein [Pectobacterium punjabense]MCE5380045.1 sulfate ABC transporter ATP-binding protein [Pectobacterium punjabense]GKW13769.1 sulfate/thiosulfate import ATP-binding protein CysA [Pectobacterium carotovorum subsp. carotovorum]
MSIEIRNINKQFGQFRALNEINLSIHSGELVALLGPSGCGKTTLLRIIAGLEQPDSGNIIFHGQDVSVHDVRKRNVGFVFQHYALFRHMTVFDNVAFGLRMKPKNIRLSKSEIEKKVHELLNLVQLDWLGDRYPEQLSGGQRQRIALARALIVEPSILLLDEPFGALDAKVRKELRRWLSQLHEDIDLTSVFVTHDQEEAMEVADRIVLMNKGVIEQIGTPAEVYNNPASEFVYHFLGDSNRLKVAQTEETILFRPHEVSLSVQAQDGYQAVTVRDIRPLGALTRLSLKLGEQSELIEAEVAKDDVSLEGLQKGDVIQFKPKRYNHDWEI